MAAKKKEETGFDLDKALEDLECPNMFKAGLGYYIEINKLTPKTDSEFKKIVKDYGKIGE